jgi:hypothetical protein
LQRQGDEVPPLQPDPVAESQLAEILEQSGEELDALTSVLRY